MGIVKFFSWFSNQQKFKTSLVGNVPPHVDIFAIDLNAIIHPKAQEFFGYGPNSSNKVIQKIDGQFIIADKNYNELKQQVFQGVFDDIVGLTKTVNPTTTLILAIDGVAPDAKINQQRNRRYKSAKDNSATDEPKIFDSNNISPGTRFMMELDAFIKLQLHMIQQSDNVESGGKDPNQEAIPDKYFEYAKIFPAQIIYSNHMVPGEGEHKIAEELSKHITQNKTLVIHGADADLIMIYLLRVDQGWKSIYLFRNHTQRYNVQVMINLMILRDVLKEMWSSEFPSEDFVALLFLNGNDFLPHFAAFEDVPVTLTTLIKAYTDFLKLNTPPEGICNSYGINWPNFLKFLKYFSDTYNNELLQNWATNATGKIKYPSLVAQSSLSIGQIIEKKDGKNIGRQIQTLNIKEFNKTWYQWIFSPKDLSVVVTPTQEDILKLCLSYIEGITWIFSYYKNGALSVNKGWTYPYNYAPLFSDIPKSLEYFLNLQRGEFWKNETLFLIRNFVSPLEQLVMILPPASLQVVLPPLRVLYSETSPIADLLPDKFVIDLNGKMEDYQGIALLPFVDTARILIAVSNLKLDNDYLYQFRAQESIEIFRIKADNLIQISNNTLSLTNLFSFPIYKLIFNNSPISSQQNKKFYDIFINKNPHLGQANFINVYHFNKLERQLRSNAPRRKYTRTPGIQKTVIHWGQRKLLMSEIEFLTNYSKENDTVLYAGAAPGHHLPYLASLFPSLKFILVDPEPFTSTVFNNQQINVRKDMFFDENMAREFSGRDDILFISDIRTKNVSNMEDVEDIESTVIEDQLRQMRWHLLMRPKYSMLKFRLPYGEGTTEYFDGTIYLPVWGPVNTTETRLVVPRNPEIKIWNNTVYEENMAYFNNVQRVSYYNHNIKSHCVDHCYDCSSEINILGKYLYTYRGGMFPTKELFWNAISSMMQEITDQIASNGRTLCLNTNRPANPRYRANTDNIIRKPRNVKLEIDSTK